MDQRWLVALVFCLVCWLWVWLRCKQGYAEHSEEVAKGKVQRQLRPASPRDCPECRVQREVMVEKAAVRPWKEIKSRRGKRKTVDTEGHACWNPACEYCGITDSRVHALVGYGGHGQRERIQDLYCQACQTKVSERRDTPLYRLKTPAGRVGEVLAALAEGLDASAAERVFGHREKTISTWVARAGMHAERLHEQFFHDLELRHVQLDELRTWLRGKLHEIWLWIALDVQTKVIAVLEVGARTQAMAHRLIHKLMGVLSPGCVPVFSSDGLNLYFYGLTAHCGEWREQASQRKPQWVVKAELVYGQIVKRYRRRRVVRVEQRMQWGKLEELKARLMGLGLSGKLNTAFVERLNLTLRQGVALLNRRTWGVAQTREGLKVYVEWWRGYYHFIRPHTSLRVALARPIARKGRQIPKRYLSRTPAMAAGVTDHRWTVREFLSYPLPEAAL